MANSGKERPMSMDLLRLLACFFVVLLHSAAICLLQQEPGSPTWWGMHFYDCLSRSCVPLFFMLSGSFLLDPSRPLTREKWGKKVGRLLLLYLLWNGFYALFGYETLPDPGEFLRRFAQSYYHLWFLRALLPCYFLLPLLRPFFRSAGRRELLTGLSVLFLFQVVLPTFLPVLPASVREFFQGFSYVQLSHLFYFLLGYGLKAGKDLLPSRNILGVLFLFAFLWAFLGDGLRSVKMGESHFSLYSYFSFPVFLEALSCFSVFLKSSPRQWPPFLQKPVAGGASFTGMIYLLHPLFLFLLVIRGKLVPNLLGGFLGVPLLAIGVFLLSLLSSLLLSRIKTLLKNRK